MNKLPQALAGFVFAGLIFTFALPSLMAGLGVPDSSAAPNDATIFTGQIIPAFIGGAYDPSEAFQKLAGLPVYVTAYDNWGVADPNKIKNNLAVRTQIRADGTFQAAGLPTAAHYGVYFPFRRSTNGAERSDGLSEGTQTAEFRWPELPDQIIDVFSYSFIDGGGITVKDQLGNDVDLGQLFTTTTTRVDKDNNINVFPVVPVRALKIAVEDQSDFSYEVHAQRITKKLTRGQGTPNYTEFLSPPLNFPVIKGRTSAGPHPLDDPAQGGLATHTFQAYAPDGYYVVTIWRNENSSETYKDWDGTSPVNSTKHGVAAVQVHKDWQNVLADKNSIVTGSVITIWGTVTNDEGQLMSSINPNLTEVQIDIGTNHGLAYRARANKNDLNADFYNAGFTNLPDPSIWGIYMISQVLPNANQTSFHGDDVCTYTTNDGFRANPASPSLGIVNSTDGPRRVDLRSQQSKQGYSGGYDQGVFLNIQDQQGRSLSSATLRLTAGQGVVEQFSIPALTKGHSADCLGNIYINPGANNYNLKTSETYLAEIRAGNRLAYHVFTYPESGYYDNGGQPIVLSTPAPISQSTYKILGKIPFPLSYTYAQPPDGMVEIPGTILTTNEQIRSLEAFVYLVGGNESQDCLRESSCQIQSGGQNIDPANLLDPNTTSFVDQFSVLLQVPPFTEDTIRKCQEAAGQGQPDLIEGCDVINGIPLISFDYKVLLRANTTNNRVVTGETTLTASSTGYHTPSFQIDLNVIDCAETFPLSWSAGLFKIGEGVSNAANRAMCSFGQMITRKISGLMDSVHNWLYIQPLNTYKGIVFMWDTVRNVVNVIFVLMLIAIGLASILRYEPESWSPSILIPRLLIGIVIANFSLLLVQAVVDVTNVTTNLIFRVGEMTILQLAPESAGRAATGLAGLIAGSLILKSLVGLISNAAFSALASAMGLGAVALPAIVVVPLLSAVIGFLGTILLMFIGIVMLLVIRYYAIWIVAITAPAVWALQVLPFEFSQTLKEKWKSTLLAFTFMQPVIAFTLTVGIVLITVSGGGDNGLFGGFGILLMGLITLGAVLKSPGFVSQFVGEGFLSMEGLGQAPEALREKLLGEEGIIPEKFSKERLMRGVRSAYEEGHKRPTLRTLGGLTRLRDIEKAEAVKELSKESEPGPPAGAQASIAVNKDKLVRAVNVNLAKQVPYEYTKEGGGPIDMNKIRANRADAPHIRDMLAGDPSATFGHEGRTTTVSDFMNDFVNRAGLQRAKRDDQLEAATAHLIGKKQGWDTLTDANEATRTPIADIEARMDKYAGEAQAVINAAKRASHAREV